MEELIEIAVGKKKKKYPALSRLNCEYNSRLSRDAQRKELMPNDILYLFGGEWFTAEEYRRLSIKKGRYL